MNADKFMAKVNKERGHWIWTGGEAVRWHGLDGLGGWEGDSRAEPIRVTWEIVHGEPPDFDVRLKRTCKEERCVRPAHVEQVQMVTRQSVRLDRIGKPGEFHGLCLKVGEHWLWRGPVTPDGKMFYGKREPRRLALQHFRKIPVSQSTVVQADCGERLCVSPWHATIRS